MELTRKFLNKIRKQKWLGGGSFANVYEGPNNTVYKVCDAPNDGAYLYLRWCKHMQDIGKNMKGMPEVISLHRGKKQYVVIMGKYNNTTQLKDAITRKEQLCELPTHIQKLLKEFHKHLFAHDFLDFNLPKKINLEDYDIHKYNVMEDDKGVMILTDPLAYQFENLHGKEQPFELLPTTPPKSHHLRPQGKDPVNRRKQLHKEPPQNGSLGF